MFCREGTKNPWKTQIFLDHGKIFGKSWRWTTLQKILSSGLSCFHRQNQCNCGSMGFYYTLFVEGILRRRNYVGVCKISDMRGVRAFFFHNKTNRFLGYGALECIGEQLVSSSEALCCSFWCSSEFTGYSECILTDLQGQILEQMS